MAFESFSEKLNGIFKKLRGKGRLTEADITAAVREVRMALLEADVSYKVVKDFTAKISEKCRAAEVLEALSPAQNIVKIVNDELTELLGGENEKLNLSNPPAIIMLCGLQGAGKTTAAGKLALLLKNTRSARPLLVACDIARPAAIQQLQTLGRQVDAPVFTEDGKKPEQIAKNAVAFAKTHGNDVVILDTAGRLHIDEELMEELSRIKRATAPQEILLAIDAMTGQDAVNTAAEFNEKIGLTGVIMTKLDGDARGGAALSVKAVTGKPIKFASTGEKLDKLEVFYPDRMASRILGMGDVLTLIEKAESAFDEKKSEELAQKLQKNKFSLQDYYDQLQQLKNMGGIQGLAGMMPGLDAKALSGANIDERAMKKTEAIILSMTPRERDNPTILAASRKRRIAAGSGTQVSDVNRLLKQFEAMKEMTKKLSKGKLKLPGMGGLPGGKGGFGGLF